jgi:hypothetical protein
MVVIAAFALALAIAPAGHPYLALLPLGVGLPAMYLRSRGEFLAVMAIVSILVLLLAPALMVARAGARVRPLPQVKVRYLALTEVNHSCAEQSGAGRWQDVGRVTRCRAFPDERYEVRCHAAQRGQIYDSLAHGDDGDRRHRLVAAPVFSGDMLVDPELAHDLLLWVVPDAPNVWVRPDQPILREMGFRVCTSRPGR